MKHLERAFDGRNGIGRYILMIFLILIVGQTVGAIPYILYKDIVNKNVSHNLELFFILIPFLVSILFFWRFMQPIHKRSFASIFNGVAKFRWKPFFIGIAVFLALQSLYLIVSNIINPANFIFQFDSKAFVPLFVISILLIPFQAGLEEILCRGYLAQGIGVLTRNRIVVLLVPTILFSLLHFANPEVREFGFWITMLQYFIIGFSFALVSILDDGIEMAIGMHAINNVFLSLFITFDASALQTSAVFHMVAMDMNYETIALLIQVVAFIFIAAKIRKWNFSILLKKIEPLRTELNTDSLVEA